MRIGEWLRRLWYLINRRRLDRELQLEIEAHREMMDEPHRFGKGTSDRPLNCVCACVQMSNNLYTSTQVDGHHGAAVTNVQPRSDEHRW
jgi:hypothetical protein